MLKELIIHLDDSGHPTDIHIDSKDGVPISAFLLLTSVPTEPPSSHMIAFGNADTVGRMLFNFWKHSVTTNPDGAFVLEEVAKDILRAAKEARGKEWPGSVVGNA